MASKELPSYELLHLLFYLDEDFELFKLTGSNKGKQVFYSPSTTSGLTYLTGSINGKKYKTHRIIWKMVHGYDPDYIDHIDGNPLNNHIDNLREVKHFENRRNTGMGSSNKSGHVGVSLDKATKIPTWRAQITDNNGKKIRLGNYLDINDAIAARKEAEIKYGYHENHGRKRKKLVDLESGCGTLKLIQGDGNADPAPFLFRNKT